MPGRLLHVARRASAPPPSTTCTASDSDGALHAPAHDLDLALRRRVVDPLVQAAALDRVVQVARAVGGQHDHRRVRRADRAELRDRHRGLGEQLEQERLEVVVGAVDLVDQQHRRPRPGVLAARAAAAARSGSRGPNRSSSDSALVVRVRQPDAQQLARIVPLVQRLGRVDPVVALQADQRRVEDRGERLGRPRSCPTPASPSSSSGCGQAEAEEHAPSPGPRRRGSRRPRAAAPASRRRGEVRSSPAASPDRAHAASLRRLGAALHRRPHARRACTACRCGRRRASRAARRSPR